MLRLLTNCGQIFAHAASPGPCVTLSKPIHQDRLAPHSPGARTLQPFRSLPPTPEGLPSLNHGAQQGR